MFCPNCGANLPDGIAFCGECGTPLAAPAPTPIPQQPKTGFTTMKLIALILTVVCIAALVISYFVVMNTSLEDISIFTILPEEALEEFEESKDSIKEQHDEIESNYERNKDDFDDEASAFVEDALDIIDDLSDSFSINNIKRLSDCLLEMKDLDEAEELDLKEEMETIEQLSSVINVITFAVLGFMLLCLAFCAFGGFFRIRGLVIAGLVFSVFYGLVFCGLLFTLLFLALDIALCVVIGLTKKESAAVAY